MAKGPRPQAQPVPDLGGAHPLPPPLESAGGLLYELQVGQGLGSTGELVFSPRLRSHLASQALEATVILPVSLSIALNLPSHPGKSGKFQASDNRDYLPFFPPGKGPWIP